MAKSDWNFVQIGTLPNWWEQRGAEPSPSDGACLMGRWNSYTSAQLLGYLYNGPSAASFPLLNGSASICVRTGAGYASHQPMGIWARHQSLNPASILDIEGYFVGVYQTNTSLGTGANIRCIRRLAGSISTVGPIQWIPNCLSSWVQFETQIENSPVNVPIIRLRWNTGSAFEEPGGPNWTSWIDLASDTGHSGITNQPGYWGFGIHHYSGGGGSSAEDWVHYFDNARILAEVP